MSWPRVQLPDRARELKTYRIDTGDLPTFEDEAGDPIPLSGLTTLTLMLFNDADGQFLNGVGPTPVNILNNGRGSVDASGKLVLTLDPNDSPIIDDSKTEELHVAFLQWSWSGGNKKGGQEVAFLVRNFVKVP